MPPVVLVLCGLVASGKVCSPAASGARQPHPKRLPVLQSTLAQALEEHMPDTWTRCCQDELKTRRKVEAAAREALDEGMSPVIDRTNVTAEQRATWVDLAREYDVSAWLLFVNTPPEECARRALLRRGHPTVPDGKGIMLIRSFGASFEPPLVEEGFDCVMELRPTDSSTFSLEDLQSILTRLSTSTLDSTAPLMTLSGPLPPPPEKKSTPKKPAVSHGRDIRSMFPLASEELSRRRLQGPKDAPAGRTGAKPAP